MKKKAASSAEPLIPTDIPIREIRGQRVLLDSDLSAIYGVPTFRFNEAIKRNRQRFPADFMFQLTKDEADALTSQIAMSKSGRGGRRTLPFAFTEHGALQAANILRSERAVAMSVYVIRAFVRMREQIAANAAILQRLAEIDKTLLEHNDALRVIWQELQPLLSPPPDPPKRRIGFQKDEK
ncbi:MAG: ORF6N domain-containing protein [Chthoniobacteraceae bacterium]